MDFGVGFFTFQSFDESVGVNGRMQYCPMLKQSHEEMSPCGGCPEEERSWGKGLLERSAEAREGYIPKQGKQYSHLEWVLFQATALAVTNL